MKNGWDIKSLNEVCQIRPPKNEIQDHLSQEDLVSFVPMDSLGVEKKYFTPSGDKKLREVYGNYTYFRDQDVLLAKITPCFENGKLGIAKDLTNGVGFGSSEYVVYRPKEFLDPQFLYYFLSQDGFRKTGESQMTGAVGHKRIPKDFYEKYQIPIPPLPEQKQIVQILDKAFAAIDQAKANIDQNIQNAQELYQSRKEELFGVLLQEFNSKPISEVCEDIFAGGDAPKDNYSKTHSEKHNIPIIANAVKDNGLYGYTDSARVTQPSITIAARGSGTGHTKYRDYPFLPIVRLIVLIPDKEIINPKYLMHAIKTLTIVRSGSAIPQLTVPMIKGYSIPVPDLEKQSNIVDSLKDLQDELDKYDIINNKKLLDCEELKKSILQKAFSGELTSGDYEEFDEISLAAEPKESYGNNYLI